MPIYDYKCSSCGHEMKGKIRPHSVTTIPCEECNSDAPRLFPGRFQAHGLPNGFLTAYKNNIDESVPNGTPKKRR